MPTLSSSPPSPSVTLPSTSNSSSATSTSFFFVWLPDCTDSDVGRRRLEATPRHIKQMLAWVVSKKGYVNYGGVTTIRPTSVQLRQATTDHAIDGSIVILEAKSSEVVWELIKADAFYTENVWDKERIVVKPFLPMSPLPTPTARL
ncbi:hypothetical protein BC629DRAFT_1591869 [Irpex lacteus]|nr:hypothetical protein BC629DRAFT_1591869 [Irpex lacteus]